MSGKVAIGSRTPLQEAYFALDSVKREWLQIHNQFRVLTVVELQTRLQHLYRHLENICPTLQAANSEDVAERLIQFMDDYECLEIRIAIAARKAALVQPVAVPAIARTPAPEAPKPVTFDEIRTELLLRKDLLLALEDEELEKSELHYEGLNPLQTRLKIIADLERLERETPALIAHCKRGQHEQVEQRLATEYHFTVHSNYPGQLAVVLSAVSGALKEAFRVAEEKDRLDEFLIKGFCDPKTQKNDGAPYDIEACLESKIAQWQHWASI